MTDELPEWACKCGGSGWPTDDGHAVNCPVGCNYVAWQRMTAKPAAIDELRQGLSHLRRLTERYDFRSEAGPLANCVDYIEAVRCFEGVAKDG